MPTNSELSRETSVCAAVFTIRPPATLFFSDTARTGLKVKYVRHVHADPKVAPVGAAGSVKTQLAVATA